MSGEKTTWVSAYWDSGPYGLYNREPERTEDEIRMDERYGIDCAEIPEHVMAEYERARDALGAAEKALVDAMAAWRQEQEKRAA